jgi:hypothetical protein
MPSSDSFIQILIREQPKDPLLPLYGHFRQVATSSSPLTHPLSFVVVPFISLMIAIATSTAGLSRTSYTPCQRRSNRSVTPSSRRQ